MQQASWNHAASAALGIRHIELESYDLVATHRAMRLVDSVCPAFSRPGNAGCMTERTSLACRIAQPAICLPTVPASATSCICLSSAFGGHLSAGRTCSVLHQESVPRERCQQMRNSSRSRCALLPFVWDEDARTPTSPACSTLQTCFHRHHRTLSVLCPTPKGDLIEAT